MFAIRETEEYFGLDELEYRMYLTAWEHNTDCLGFAGLCNLWYQEITQTITLENISRVWQKLIKYSYFQTSAYWYNRIRGVGSVDYIPEDPRNGSLNKQERNY